MTKQVILTGIRSNGELTLGNYLGAIQPLVALQRQHAGEYQVNMFVPDLHSFTTPVEHNTLYQNTLDNLRTFAAAGLQLDQPDSYIYRQSYVPAHSELTWILDCFSYFGELSRMTQFKEKSLNVERIEAEANKVMGDFSGLSDRDYWKVKAPLLESTAQRQEQSVSVGLFNYPVLMAADILLYGARYVPVGEDQRQHLELARDLAVRINNKFGEDILLAPETWDKQLAFAGQFGSGTRIRSLRNPDKKMSKSVSDPNGTILLTDEPVEAAKKVISATTDSIGTVHYDYKSQPGISNLLAIGALLSGHDMAEYVAGWEGRQQYGELKKTVAQEVERFLTNFQQRRSVIPEMDIAAALERGEAMANDAANSTLLRVQQVVGLRPHA